MANAARPNHIRIEPVTGALGAMVEGVDLAQPLDRDTFSDIKTAFQDHLVVFFRDQVLTPEQHLALARQFGELHIHPTTASKPGYPEILEVIKEANEKENWGDGWHSDLPFLASPPAGSFLLAREVPPFGGDTQFANMYIAYEALSDEMKRIVDPLKCLHLQNPIGYRPGKNRSMRFLEAEPTEAIHPLVRIHPVTGKKALFPARKGLGRIQSMKAAESEAILDFVRVHAENSDFACRFRWEKNSLAFWDNHATQHRVTADYFFDYRGYEPHRRHMDRVTIA
ncbi:MAG: taurine dioxygenase [Rhizobiales bacterium]|nr:taurine dioxygenase [Hyphomicrobiales bacterium]